MWLPTSEQDVEARRTQVGQATISYRVAGAGDPVVLVHGLGGSSRWWWRTIDALAANFQVYAVDLVRFGGSRCADPFMLDAAAEHVSRWLDQEGLDRVHLVGHSLGGHVATQLAADHPEQIDRLVLVSAAAPPFRGHYLRHSLQVARGSVQYGLAGLMLTDACRAGPVTLWKAARQVLRNDLSAKIPNIRAETLIIWGDDDALIPLDVGYRLYEEIEHSRLEIMPGAGHAPIWHDPERFNGLVRDFLLDDESGAGAPLPPPALEGSAPRTVAGQQGSQAAAG
jgi:pimeloyl-ACP methyl ester carboxylesterase